MPSLVAGTVTKLENILFHFDQWATCNSLELQNNRLFLKEIKKNTILMSVFRFEIAL